jgi:hypothetical protein
MMNIKFAAIWQDIDKMQISKTPNNSHLFWSPYHMPLEFRNLLSLN